MRDVAQFQYSTLPGTELHISSRRSAWRWPTFLNTALGVAPLTIYQFQQGE